MQGLHPGPTTVLQVYPGPIFLELKFHTQRRGTMQKLEERKLTTLGRTAGRTSQIQHQESCNVLHAEEKGRRVEMAKLHRGQVES